MLELGMLALRSDPEDTAILGLRLVMDIHKVHRDLDNNSAGQAVEKLLHFAEKAFENLPVVAAGLLGGDMEKPDDIPVAGAEHKKQAAASDAADKPDPAAAGAASSSSSSSAAGAAEAAEAAGAAGSGEQPATEESTDLDVPCTAIAVPDETRERMREVALGKRVLRPGESLKVLTELPLLIMMVLQLNPRYVQRHTPTLAVHMATMLNIRVPLEPPKDLIEAVR